MTVPNPLQVIRCVPRWAVFTFVVILDVSVVVWLGRAGLQPGRIVGTSADPYIYFWFIHWWGWALTHHRLAWVTHLVSVPYGNNVLWDTAVPLFFIPLSILHQGLRLPVTVLYNGLWVASWAGSAIVAYITFVRITGHRLASVLGQLLVLLCAYENTESLAHLDLTWLGFAFLFLMTGVEWWLGRRDLTSWVGWSTLWGVLQWFSNEEIFVLMWTAALLALGLALILEWLTGSIHWDRWTQRLRGLALTGLLTTVCLLPEYWLQSHTPLQPLNSIRFAGIFGVDLTNLFFIPVHTVFHWGNPLSWGPDPYEDTGYLGLPFILGALVYWILQRSRWSPSERPVARLLFVWWAALVVLALGAFARFNGHSSGFGALPGLVLYFLPVFRDIVLPRFMGLSFWVAGLAAALALKTASRRAFLAIAGVILLIAASWMPSGFPALRPGYASRGLLTTLSRLHLPKNPVILVFPYDNVGDPTPLMASQAIDNFQFRLAEGYLSPSDYLLLHYPRLIAAWDRLDAPALNPHDHVHIFPAARWRRVTRQYLRQTHPSVLIVLRHTAHVGPTLTWWRSILGPASGHTAAAVYWLDPAVKSTTAGHRP